MARGILLGESNPNVNPETDFYLPRGVEELVDLERRNWRAEQRALKDSGVPTSMPNQPFRALFPNNQEPPIVNATEAVIATTEDKILWDPAGLAPQTAIPANSLYADVVVKVTAWGVMTTVVTGAQTAEVTPRFGTTVSGTSLGASRAQPVVAEVLTNTQWLIEMWMHVRLVGSSGTATCGGMMACRAFVGTAATTNTAPVNFGTNSATATTINTTTASGLLVSIKATTATQKYTTLGVVMESLN